MSASRSSSQFTAIEACDLNRILDIADTIVEMEDGRVLKATRNGQSSPAAAE